MLIPGERGTVESFKTPTHEVRHRLMEMGLTRGTAVEVIRLAPLGDPIEISIRGYRLSLRRREASAVVVRRQGKAVSRVRRFHWRRKRQ